MDKIKIFDSIYKEKCSKYKYIPSILPPVDRIIVIGDIHGDMDKLLECLKIAKLINKHKKWIGKDTVVVQVGDQIDSCRYNGIDNCNDPNKYETDMPDDINILYFMTDLHNQAIKDGGAVYSIMGNHELMNTVGDLSYVSYSNINSFKNYKTPNGIIEDGYKGREYAFTPGNDIANFLACTRQMALIIGSNLFVHAGIIPYIASKYNTEDMNKLLTLFLLGEIEKPDIFYDLFISGTTSPLWTRIFGMKIENCYEIMQPLKQIYNVNKIYVGHTPQLKTGIYSQCDNTVWMTDVGMSYAFDKLSKDNINRNAQVLEILKDGEVFNILK